MPDSRTDAGAVPPAAAGNRMNLTECPVIVGTAGHVDHGKSSLIHALTGKNPDRLAVERRRGMTVELGFGELALPSGRLVGLVDVPGHAHYLRAMVQGATGVDVAVLAVSAVEGVMPQTREHVHVLELLGVRRMVVALTFIDQADAEMAELAELDVADFLSGTVFADAPVVGVSSLTGEGLPRLLEAIDAEVDAFLADRAQAPARPGLLPRLPVDRCFTIQGAGAVVTGTLWDAPLKVGDELIACPSGSSFRVRGLQVHGDTDKALPGQRVAANLVGDGAASIPRGEMLCGPGADRSTLRLAASLTYLGREGARPRPLRSGERVHVMLGCAEVIGRVMLYERDGGDGGQIDPGGTMVVQLRLEEALPARAGDRFIVLSYSPVQLIGGGTVLLSRCRRTRELSPAAEALLEACTSGGATERLRAWFGLQGLPVRLGDAVRALDLTDEEASAALSALVDEGAVKRLGAGFHLAPEALDAALSKLAEALGALHGAAPKKTGFTPAEVMRAAYPGLSDEDAFAALVGEGEARGICASEAGELFDPHSSAAAARLAAEAAERILGLLDERGLDAPTLGELGDELGIERDTLSKAVRQLTLDRAAVRIERDVIISAAAEKRARAAVADAIQAAGGAATASALREALGVSRKRALAVLQYLDSVRFTVLDKDAGGLRSLR